jgi:polyvinyl alcohol dehydrogenase (cytochrome)
VFVGTGNNYTAPDPAVACAQNPPGNPPSDASCTASNDYFDSMLALNLQTGAIEWGQKLQGYDAWNVACAIGLPPGATWCPSPQSPDWDFGGSSPNLFTVKGADGTTKTLVGDGQRSGAYWAFDEATGARVWHTLGGPGSSLGGIEWRGAYDGHRIYIAEANAFDTPFTFANGTPVSGGSWAALDPAAGAFDWQNGHAGRLYRPRTRQYRRRGDVRRLDGSKCHR